MALCLCKDLLKYQVYKIMMEHVPESVHVPKYRLINFERRPDLYWMQFADSGTHYEFTFGLFGSTVYATFYEIMYGTGDAIHKRTLLTHEIPTDICLASGYLKEVA